MMKTYLHNVPDIRNLQFCVKLKWKTQSVQAAMQRIVNNTPGKTDDFDSEKRAMCLPQAQLDYAASEGRNIMYHKILMHLAQV